jgi:hypothetical protein
LVRGDVRDLLLFSIRPADFQIRDSFRSETEVQAPIIGGKIRRLRQHSLHLLPFALCCDDLSADRAAVRLHTGNQDLQLAPVGREADLLMVLLMVFTTVLPKSFSALISGPFTSETATGPVNCLPSASISV